MIREFLTILGFVFGAGLGIGMVGANLIVPDGAPGWAWPVAILLCSMGTACGVLFIKDLERY